MPSLLPVSRAVNVSVSLTPAGALAQSTSNLLIMSSSNQIDGFEAYREYAALAEVAGDFATDSAEYLAARRWFSQSPKPKSLMIARWFAQAGQGGLRGAPLTVAQQNISGFQTVTAGAFAYSKDGGAVTQVTGLNFSAASNLNAVATILQNAMAGVQVRWNAVYGRFEFDSATGGPTSVVSFLQSPSSGLDISSTFKARADSSGAYVFGGRTAEAADAAAIRLDDLVGQKWYGIVYPSILPGATGSNTALMAVSQYIEAANNKHMHFATSSEAGSLVAATTTDFGALVDAAGLDRTLVQYSSTDPYSVLSLAARLLTVNYGGSNTAITLKFKLEPGVVAESLSTSQANALKGKNINVFVGYENDTAIIQEGTMASGVFADIIHGTDWLALQLQNRIYNLLYTSLTKIPQTNQGMQVLTTGCAAVCTQAVTNGLVAPGVWDAGGFGELQQGDYLQSGFYIYADSVDLQDPADRAARMAMPIQIAVKLAGAIHFADAAISVNQ